MTARYAYPPDDPATLATVRASLDDARTLSAGLGERLESTRSIALEGWTGIAADAARAAMVRRTTATESAAVRLGASAHAIETYRGVVVQARAEIDRLRAQHAALTTAAGHTDAAIRSFVANPTPAHAVALTAALTGRVILARRRETLATEYGLVIQRVAEAARDCIETLWDKSSGARSLARELAERDEARYSGPPGFRSDGTSPEGSGQQYPNGLGSMVPGTSTEHPGVPPWPAGDAGAGEYASETAMPDDYATHQAAWLASNLLDLKWPHASENLRRFLANKDGALEQDVDAMLGDLDVLSTTVEARRMQLGQLAVTQAQAAGATGPVTFPVSTGWQGYYATPDQSEDWYYATGGFQYSQQGQVTVYPPSTPGGAWTYATTTVVSTYDRYNWDGGKQTEILGRTVTDEQLAELHRAGLAREYDLYGTSAPSTTEG